MSIGASQVIEQPLLRLDTGKGSGFQVASGIAVLDLTNWAKSPAGDWQRDDAYWEIHINTSKWTKEVKWALIVFPTVIDVSGNAAVQNLGWGIDEWSLDLVPGIPNPLHDSHTVGIRARIVLKTLVSEVLRVGYQLTLIAG